MNEDDRTYAPEDVVIHTQPERTVYGDQKGQLAIRQRYDDDDIWIIVSRGYISALAAVIDRIAPDTGFIPLEHDDEGEEVDEQPPPVREPPPAPSRSDLKTDALRAGGKSKRQIAREAGVSEAIVWRVDATLGATLVRLDCHSPAADAPVMHPDTRDDAPNEPSQFARTKGGAR